MMNHSQLGEPEKINARSWVDTKSRPSEVGFSEPATALAHASRTMNDNGPAKAPTSERWDFVSD